MHSKKLSVEMTDLEVAGGKRGKRSKIKALQMMYEWGLDMGKGKRIKAVRRAGAKVPDGVTPAQFKAIKAEIDFQVKKADRKYSIDFASVVLWVLHEEFGFGPRRLRRMWDGYDAWHKKLKQHYEITEEDTPFECRRRLKEIGVDVEAWDKEIRR